MTIPATLFPIQSGDDRGAERVRMRFGAVWLDHGPGAHELTVLDVSTTGFLLETDQTLPVKTSLIVELPDGVCKTCRIVWSSGQFRGAVFSEPLSDTELQGIIFAVRDPLRRLKQVYQFEADDEGEGVEATDLPEPEVRDDERLPFATRGKIILGSTALLWAAIGSLAWAVVAA